MNNFGLNVRFIRFLGILLLDFPKTDPSPCKGSYLLPVFCWVFFSVSKALCII